MSFFIHFFYQRIFSMNLSFTHNFYAKDLCCIRNQTVAINIPFACLPRFFFLYFILRFLLHFIQYFFQQLVVAVVQQKLVY